MGRIQRVYCEHELTLNSTFTLSGDAHHYLSRVLRIKAQDEVHFFNHLGKEFLCRLHTIDRKTATFSCVKEIAPLPEPTIAIQLNIAVCKSDTMALIVQKATELGIRTIQPLKTANNQHSKIRLSHLRAVARSATEQCGRVIVPTICEPLELSDVSTPSASQRGIVLDPYAEHSQSLSQILPPKIKNTNCVIIAIGPEGGWQNDEVTTLEQRGFEPLYLGSRILRSETAVISALTLVQHQLGQLG